MTLSLEHQSLIDLALDWCASQEDQSKYLVFSDTLSGGKNELPPAIGNYRPDLAWLDLRGRYRFIGEAKSRSDFHSLRTRKQLSSFLDLIVAQGHGLLVVAVPLGLEGAANLLLSSIYPRYRDDNELWTVISNAPRQDV